MPHFLSFQEVSSKQLDPNLVGGKASALAQLYQNGFPVPNGFIITTEFFSDFLIQNGIPLDNVNALSMLKSAKFSNEVIKDIYKYAENCCQERLMAIRSSASMEDSNYQSFAGQFESFLGVKKEDILETIKKCWHSLQSPRVYRYTQHKNHTGKMAVLVQAMIDPEVSGVAFSTHPVTRDLNSMVIEAVFGSNELLVQGFVTPDCYVINKNFEILDKKISAQKEMKTINKEGGMISKIPVDENQQKLSDRQIFDVARMINDVKTFFDKPVDVEWAIEDGRLYILQSRPITTIY